MIATKIIFDPSTFRCTPSFEEVDEALQLDTQQHRLKFCRSCENFAIRDVSGNSIQVCGCCGLAPKLTRIYPEDENGNAFFYTTKDGQFGYVCPLKKW